MVSIDTIQAMLVKDWDDGCTLSLYAEDTKGGPCGADPFWKYSKEQIVEMGRYNEADGYTCQQNIDQKGTVAYYSYTCE